MDVHDLGFEHLHMTPEQEKELADTIWAQDNVVLTTVGVDVGSSTSHLMFSKVHLQRLSEGLSSRFVVVARKVLEVVAEMSDWGSKMETNRGRGIAFASSFGVPTAEVIEVTNTDSGIQIDKVFVALDVGRVVDPVSFENIVQGGVIWALGHAINSEITYEDGQAQQSNYYDAEGMRLYQAPDITVRGLENASKIRGVGEPPVPPAAPALANAIFAATGQRIREMPFNKHIDFV